MPGFIFVPERVGKFQADHVFTGYSLTRPIDLPIVDYGFIPGRLSYWLPDDKARPIGEPLGI